MTTNEPLQDHRLWFSHALAGTASTSRRKIHLDFHNSEHMSSVGQEFDGGAFATTLRDAHVDSIVLFAKDMHGYFYYPTALGPIHPALGSRDLLGEQIQACRESGIKVFAYYCTTWDNHLAELHPEWLSLKRDRTSYLPNFDETPGWTAMCMSNDGFVELMLAHTREILERYDIDRLWFDMPVTNHDQECYCRNCIASMRTRGLDIFDREAQGQRTQELLLKWMKASWALAQEIRPGIGVEQNQQTRLGLHERIPFVSNVDIEALPTGHWGYPYYPMMARYARALGVPFTGLTGRFQAGWADFGGLKSENQLRLEVASIVALGGAVSVGDQAPPSARLDAGVYQTIGAAYAYLSDVDDYLAGAVHVSEAALLVDGPMVTDFARLESQVDPEVREGALGMAKLLVESRVQFDVVQPGTVDLNRYGVLFLPDGLPLSSETVSLVQEFARGGGRIVQSVRPDVSLQSSPWLLDLGVTASEPSPFVPAFTTLSSNYPSAHGLFEFAMYDGAARWQATAAAPTTVIATLDEPSFQRSPERYTSHGYSPVQVKTDFPVVLTRGDISAFAFPLGAGYHRYGYWIYADLFRRVIERVLPAPLVSSPAHPSLELSLTYQPPSPTRAGRLMVHAVNFTGASRRGAHLEYFDYVAPVHDVVIRVRVGVGCVRAFEARSGRELDFSEIEGGSRLPSDSSNTARLLFSSSPKSCDRLGSVAGVPNCFFVGRLGISG